MEGERKAVINDIRALLISVKGKITLNQLEQDYRLMIGHRIQYPKFGYSRLEEFLQSEPSLVVTKQSDGLLYVDAKASEKSAHIAELVNKQKTDKKKVLRSRNRKAPRFSSSRAQGTANWRPKYVQPERRYKKSPRLAAVHHNQFLHRPSYDKPLVPSKVIIPPNSGLKPKKIDMSARLQVAAIIGKNKESDSKNGTVNNVIRTAVNKHIVKPLNNIADEGLTAEPCSSLSSTKKRITQKMSEISLDRDSGNSSPINDILANPFKITEFELTNDPVKDLKAFVEQYKLGDHPDYSTKRVKTKQNNLYTCLLKVGDKHSYTSYPEEFRNAKEAERYCAQEALRDLIPRYGRRKSLLIANFKDILERIPPMLEKHNHGIWVWQLELDYSDKYNEKLPRDWIKIIDSSPCIQLEKCLDSYVIRHCRPEDKGQQPYHTFMTLADVSVPSNTVQFRPDGTLDAEITCVLSANEVWCIQYGTEESDNYNEMIGRMEIYYNLNEANLKIEMVATGAYYVTKYDDQWCRIKVIQHDGNEILCFFIDFGDELMVPLSTIRQLKREFALFQAQAFVCRMVGLEDLYEASQTSETLQTLMYKQVILELASEAINFEDDITLPVYMHDIETGDSINKMMIPLITIESASPHFLKDTITEVYVSNIESNGDVYVQNRSRGYHCLQKLLSDVEAQITENPPLELVKPVTKRNSGEKVFLAMHKVDLRYYRIQIIDWSPNEELAQIYFVDYGDTQVIHVKDEVLYPLDNINDIINEYPFQAVKVKMAVTKVPENFVELAKKAMPTDHPVLMKIIDYDAEGTPISEFFRRNLDGGLFCINKSITMETELRNSPVKTIKRIRSNMEGNLTKNVPSGGKLQQPELPIKDELYEVHVPFVVNPYNFFVQPLKSLSKLHKLMEELQQRYKDVLYSPLQIDQIVPGNIYVSKHDDGVWYRTSVIKVIHSGSISVFYCDFGYYANLTVQQLIPLDIEFMELPYQALKAKLGTIKPKHSKWTVEDCEYFKKLVEKKNYYSLVLGTEKDELYESDLVLNLILIDTSLDEDVYVASELIAKGIAVEKN